MSSGHFVGLVVVLALASKVCAQHHGIEGVDEAFSRWMREVGVTRATLSVALGDRLVFVRGYGGLSGECSATITSAH